MNKDLKLELIKVLILKEDDLMVGQNRILLQKRSPLFLKNGSIIITSKTKKKKKKRRRIKEKKKKKKRKGGRYVEESH